MKLFGFEFPFNQRSSKSTVDTKPSGTAISPIPPENQDGALNVQYGTGAGYFGYYIDLDGAVVDDFSLINRYREMQHVAEVDEAIDQLVNDLVIQDDGRMPVSLNLDYVDDSILDPKVKARIVAEFDGILKQMKMHKDAYSVMRQWYVDGRLYYHLVVDEDAPENGIQEMRLIDPRCIRKIREVVRKRHEETAMDIIEVQREYFTYNPMGFASPSVNQTQMPTASMLQYNGIRLTLDSVVYCPSGLYDSQKRTVLSWLHKAIKPLNLLRMIEDACVIYRVSRAPERRVFYIDVGNLPKAKAEAYLEDIMRRYKNKLVYDIGTGELRDDRRFLSMLEDFWLPRREGGKGTEISTLQGGQNLSEMEDVDYFRHKLYRALNLPPSRIDQGTGFNLGRASEISRDELRFSKFIKRLQNQFAALFDQVLERQLRLKKVLTEREWETIKDNIRYDWQKDSYFEELKNQDIWTARMNLVTQMEPYIGRFFSEKWITREILKFTEDQFAQIQDDFAQSKVSANGAATPFGGDEDEDVSDSPFGDEGDDTDEEDFDDVADGILSSTDDEKDSDEDDSDNDGDDDTKPPFAKKKKESESD